MVASAEEGALTGLWFVDERHAPNTGVVCEEADFPLFVELRGQLAQYFAGEMRSFNLSLAPQGTVFQMAVWEILRTIPYGETISYGTVAQRVAGQRNGRIPAAQAVGGAVGRNPISIIIPCHRVIGTVGSLTGYAGGLDRKTALLSLEASGLPSAP
jgi:methylated-DNA-[protein]-cysteine S-methyltransferase